jgi:hypothetical protein
VSGATTLAWSIRELAALAPRRPPGPDVSAHLDEASALYCALLLLIALFFALRGELWRRLWFTRINPTPLGLFRIAFGLLVIWATLDLLPFAHLLFSDEGLWLTRLARRSFGGAFRYLWDPVHGFQHVYDLAPALWHGFSPLHIRSDPGAVYLLIAATLSSALLMTLGVWTRLTTLTTWLLVNGLYCHNTVFYSGADTVLRVFLFLGVFSRWGAAYSLDSWWRTKREVLAGDPPTRPRVPAWPVRLMQLQLVIIYATTGLLKTGGTWRDGTALYYATSLEHFFRAPSEIVLIAWMQRLWILPLATWLTLAWEILFPLVLLGYGLRVYEDERRRGVWIGEGSSRGRRLGSYALVAAAHLCVSLLVGLHAYYNVRRIGPWHVEQTLAAVIVFAAIALGGPLLVALYRYTRATAPRLHKAAIPWLLGRRVWLGWGIVFHLGIELLMNVGMFVQVMLAPYLLWLSAGELEGMWRALQSRPRAPGEERRPRRAPGALRWPLRAWDRLRYRAARAPYRVHHGPGALATRRAALLRSWDLSGRLQFVPASSPRALMIETPSGDQHKGAAAGVALSAILPALWPLYLPARVPGLSRLVGRAIYRLLGQESRIDAPSEAAKSAPPRP